MALHDVTSSQTIEYNVSTGGVQLTPTAMHLHRRVRYHCTPVHDCTESKRFEMLSRSRLHSTHQQQQWWRDPKTAMRLG